MKPSALKESVSRRTVLGAVASGTFGLGIGIEETTGELRRNSAAVDAVMIELAM